MPTSGLIDQYNRANANRGKRYGANGKTALQKRIDTIVDLLDERADRDDKDALQWFLETPR